MTGSDGRARPRRAWRIHAWGDPDIERQLLASSVIAIGGHELDDLSDGPSDDELRAELAARFPDRTLRGIDTFVSYWRQFLHDMQVGDIVAMPMTGRVAVGRVIGDYEYRPSAPERIRHARRVEWLAPGLPRDAFDDDIRRTFGSRGTICSFRAPRADARLEAAAQTGTDPGSPG